MSDSPEGTMTGDSVARPSAGGRADGGWRGPDEGGVVQLGGGGECLPCLGGGGEVWRRGIVSRDR